MNIRPGISPEPLPQGPSEVCEQVWHDATLGATGLASASSVAEHWLNKGGDIHRRTTRFMVRESQYAAQLSAAATVSGRAPSRCRALDALYGTAAQTLIPRWRSRSLWDVVADSQLTGLAGRRFLQLYVALVFPPLAPLR